jgi:hypothetical protein
VSPPLPAKKEPHFSENARECEHEVVCGFGLMGDAVNCVHCGISKYPEVITFARELPATPENVERARAAHERYHKAYWTNRPDEQRAFDEWFRTGDPTLWRKYH